MALMLARSLGPCYATPCMGSATKELAPARNRPPTANVSGRRQCSVAAHTPSAAAAVSLLVSPAQLELDYQGPSGGGGHIGGNGHGDGRGSGASGGGGHWQEGPQTFLLALLLGVAVAMTGMFSPLPAHAWGGKKKPDKKKSKKSDHIVLPDNKEIEEFASRMAGLAGPILTNMGFSGVLGACSAAALKCVGRRLAAVVGVVFVGLQALTYYGYITVNWTKVSDEAREALDATGDGRLDESDIKSWVKKGMVVMSQGLPSTSGFLFGFMTGLRMF